MDVLVRTVVCSSQSGSRMQEGCLFPSDHREILQNPSSQNSKHCIKSFRIENREFSVLFFKLRILLTACVRVLLVTKALEQTHECKWAQDNISPQYIYKYMCEHMHNILGETGIKPCFTMLFTIIEYFIITY